MKKTFIIFAVSLSIFFCAAAWAQQMKEGLWEITTQLEMKGLPQAMPPVSVRQCVTKKDPVPKSEDKSVTCQTTSKKISGNKVSYAMECKGKEETMLISGDISYTGESMSGNSTTVIKVKGQPEMRMSNKLKGKYLGACPK